MGSEANDPIVTAVVNFCSFALKQRRCQAFLLRVIPSPAEVQSFKPRITTNT